MFGWISFYSYSHSFQKNLANTDNKKLAVAFSFCFTVGTLHHVGTVSTMNPVTCFHAMVCIFCRDCQGLKLFFVETDFKKFNVCFGLQYIKMGVHHVSMYTKYTMLRFQAVLFHTLFAPPSCQWWQHAAGTHPQNMRPHVSHAKLGLTPNLFWRVPKLKPQISSRHLLF